MFTIFILLMLLTILFTIIGDLYVRWRLKRRGETYDTFHAPSVRNGCVCSDCATRPEQGLNHTLESSRVLGKLDCKGRVF